MKDPFDKFINVFSKMKKYCKESIDCTGCKYRELCNTQITTALPERFAVEKFRKAIKKLIKEEERS